MIPLGDTDVPPPSRSPGLSGVVPYDGQARDRYRSAGLWKERTISQALAEVASQQPDRTALITPVEELTYAQLLERVDCIAAGLLALGLTPGERVLFQLTNTAHAITAWYGVLRAGLIPVCTLAIHREHEIVQVGAKTGASVHLIQADFPGYDLVALAARAAAELADMRQLVTVGQAAAEVSEGAVRIEDLEKRTVSAAQVVELDGIQAAIDLDQPAILQLSGGTTGTPKVIPRLHPEYWYNGLATARWWELGPDDRLAFGLPISHNAGVANAVFAAHSVGAALLLSSPATDELLPLMAAHHATWLLSPPGLMRSYLDDARFDRAFAHLRTLVLSAAPVPRPLFDELEARGVHVTQAFGMTEGLFLFTPHEASVELRATTVGRPISPLDEVRLLDLNTEREVPDGQVGELCVRGPYTICGYLDEAERNSQAFTADGFYRSGDLAVRVHFGDEIAYQLSGRSKDLINRGGEKINAEEVESLLVQYPGVVEAALVAMPDDRLGERACAFVVVPTGSAPTVADFQHFLTERGVAKFKWPEKVMVLDSLPRTNVGKVNKLELRAHLDA